MKVIYSNNRIIAVCTDDYSGPMSWVDVDESFPLQDIENYEVLNGELALKVPASITMRQCRLQLLATGKLALVAPAIAALPSPQKEAAEIEWEYGAVVQRSSPLIAQLAPVLGWNTPEEVDEQFRQAALL